MLYFLKEKCMDENDNRSEAESKITNDVKSVNNQADNNSFSDDTKTYANRKEILEFITGAGPIYFAIVFGIIYVLGFLIINTHLSKFGIFELDIASVRYVTAGAIYCAFLLIFYLFAGRAIIHGKKWLSKELLFLYIKGIKGIWPLITFIESIINFIFFICLSAAAFVTIAYDLSQAIYFYSFLLVVFLIVYPLELLGFDGKFPRANLIFLISYKVIAILLFLLTSANYQPMIVFYTYFGIAIYINFVLDRFERWKINSDIVLFTIMHAMIFFLGTAITFGSLIYGEVTTEIGGGKPMEATIKIEDDFKKYLDGIDIIKGEKTVNIVYLTKEYLFIKTDKETLRIPESAIKVISFKKTERSYLPHNLLHEPNKSGDHK
jgi:hypothetical protein